MNFLYPDNTPTTVNGGKPIEAAQPQPEENTPPSAPAVAAPVNDVEEKVNVVNIAEDVLTEAPGHTKPLQFTAKAGTVNKEFGEYVEAVIKWRIANGHSKDRQHCIFQMFNFAVNHSKQWVFSTPEEIKKVYLK